MGEMYMGKLIEAEVTYRDGRVYQPPNIYIRFVKLIRVEYKYFFVLFRRSKIRYTFLPAHLRIWELGEGQELGPGGRVASSVLRAQAGAGGRGRGRGGDRGGPGGGGLVGREVGADTEQCILEYCIEPSPLFSGSFS